ncbi:MAG: DUF2703 domain-containing protein [Patescibacteria group bacterium]
MVRIQVLHNQECNFWQHAWKLLEDFIREKNLDANLEEVLIANDEEAVKYHFFGSPHILINGQDLDPEARRVSNFHTGGCRPYFYKDKHYDYPPRQMIEEVIARLT